MAGWLIVLLVSVTVLVACAEALFVVGVVGARRKLSGGPVVAAARVLFSVLLVAVLVALVSGLWGLVEMLVT